MLAKEEMKGVKRYRFFRVGDKSSAAYLGNRDVASDVGVLKFIYGSITQSSFEHAVVGEYHVDVLGFDKQATHDDFFGEYQMYVAGKDKKSNMLWQPGFRGVRNYLGYVTYNGWYSLPSLGECHRSSLGDSILWRTVADGGCRWEVYERPRLVEYSCLQDRMCQALHEQGLGCNPAGTFEERQKSLQDFLGKDTRFQRTADWKPVMEAFLTGFEPDECPEVAEVLTCCCRWMTIGSSPCDGIGEGGEHAQTRTIDGSKYCCKTFKNTCPSRTSLERYRTYHYNIEGQCLQSRPESIGDFNMIDSAERMDSTHGQEEDAHS